MAPKFKRSHAEAESPSSEPNQTDTVASSVMLPSVTPSFAQGLLSGFRDVIYRYPMGLNRREFIRANALPIPGLRIRTMQSEAAAAEKLFGFGMDANVRKEHLFPLLQKCRDPGKDFGAIAGFRSKKEVRESWINTDALRALLKATRAYVGDNWAEFQERPTSAAAQFFLDVHPYVTSDHAAVNAMLSLPRGQIVPLDPECQTDLTADPNPTPAPISSPFSASHPPAKRSTLSSTDQSTPTEEKQQGHPRWLDAQGQVRADPTAAVTQVDNHDIHAGAAFAGRSDFIIPMHDVWQATPWPTTWQSGHLLAPREVSDRAFSLPAQGDATSTSGTPSRHPPASGRGTTGASNPDGLSFADETNAPPAATTTRMRPPFSAGLTVDPTSDSSKGTPVIPVHVRLATSPGPLWQPATHQPSGVWSSPSGMPWSPPAHLNEPMSPETAAVIAQQRSVNGWLGPRVNDPILMFVSSGHHNPPSPDILHRYPWPQFSPVGPPLGDGQESSFYSDLDLDLDFDLDATGPSFYTQVSSMPPGHTAANPMMAALADSPAFEFTQQDFDDGYPHRDLRTPEL